MGRNIKLVFLLVTCYLLLVTSKVYAATSCQPIYGGGQTCTASSNISIDKKILNPKTNLMVDNLSINDPKYQPNFIITFQIKITNTGSNILSKVDIKDIFPQYMSFSSGDGSFDSNTKTLLISTSNLNPNETRTFNIFGRIAVKDQLPQGIVCIVNQTTATADNSQTSQDNAQLCIENVTENVAIQNKKGGFPIFPTNNIKQTPATGPESLVLFSLIPTGIAGWFLRKHAD